MRVRPTRRPSLRRRSAAAILATAVASLTLVAITSTTTSAAPVNASIPVSCGARGGDQETVTALNLASQLVGSNRLKVNLNISSPNIPERAGLDETIDAKFNWAATLDQALIDGAAGLVSNISLTNLKGTMLVTGPSSVPEFTGSAPNTTVTPVKGQAKTLNLGTYGEQITTTGGGIITYRIGSLQFDSSLSVGAPLNQSFNLKLACSVQGSNLVAKTTVRDPDAPIFDPEVIPLEATPGGTATVDLLGDVISPGKTPLLPETLAVVEPPAAGTASISNGVFSFTAPAEPGTYSTTVEVCGAPKPDSGLPGINEQQRLSFGDNWKGGGGLVPRPIAFSFKVGEEETGLIWATEQGILPTPTPEDWAPENRAGQVGQYALLTSYREPRAADVKAALEALPSIGAGNVEVTDIREPVGDPDAPFMKLVGFDIEYIGDKAEQDIPAITLGQWYSVPPQEVLDRISAAISEVTAGLGEGEGEGDGEGGGEEPAPNPLEGLTPAQADKYIGDKLLASLTGGPAVTDAEWEGWVQIRIIDPLIAAVPAIIEFINGLFPTPIFAETTTEGETPTPPQPLCAQAIVDVTVAEVAAAVEEAPTGGEPDVLGSTAGRGIGFVG